MRSASTLYGVSSEPMKRAGTVSLLPAIAPDTLARTLPFAAFILLLALDPWCARLLAEHADFVDPRWSYGLRVLAATLLLVAYLPRYRELAPATWPAARECVEAFIVGLAVLGVWLLLDDGIFTTGSDRSGFDPRTDDGSIFWPLALLRLAGAALVVPLIEELFWRSFLMRWLEDADYLALAPAAVSLRALLLSSLVFGFEHNQWAAGIIAGIAFGALYRRHQRLWSAVIAHATTNTGLALWVLYSGNWRFW
jgi:CAAX prenyl protease-like protein